MRKSKTAKQIGVMVGSGLSAAAALWGANSADALYRLKNGTDFLSNMATKPISTSAGFSVSGINSLGSTTAYTYRSGGTIYANIYSAGGTMYTRAFARCYSWNLGVYSAAYSAATTNSTYKSISCSALPSVPGGWQLAGWGATVVSGADSSVPGASRKVCDGQGCGAPDTMKVSGGFLNCYSALGTNQELIGGSTSTWPYTVSGPSEVCGGIACW